MAKAHVAFGKVSYKRIIDFYGHIQQYFSFIVVDGSSWSQSYGTARTARFSKKSPWSVFFRDEMSVICHKITVKCR
jgi:hypothetical protein